MLMRWVVSRDQNRYSRAGLQVSCQLTATQWRSSGEGPSLITNLLPGLRDLRTPLATGYLWLTFLWLLLHKHVPTSVATAKGPLRSLYELSDLIGKGAILTATTFIAYLLGSLLIKPYSRPLHIDSKLTDEDLYRGLDAKPSEWAKLFSQDEAQSAVLQLISFIDYQLREVHENIGFRVHREVLKARRVPVIQEDDDPAAPILNLRAAYVSSIVADFDLIGMQLQARNRNFWDTYDRKTAEMDFRYSIIWPLAAIIVTISWQSSLLWLLLLAVPFWLFLVALHLSAEVATILVQAISLGIVVPPIFEDLHKTVQKRKEASGPQTDGKSPQATSAAVEA